MMRVVVATIVHHPEDARIRHRQIESLLESGAEVTYIAPAGDLILDPRVRRRVVPCASGRNRLPALRQAWVALREETPRADVTVVHDPELILAARAIEGPRVWDVHEDTAAQLADKPYLPRSIRPLVRLLARHLESRGERDFQLLIAERGYAARFPTATLVRNTVRPNPNTIPPGQDKAVYLGRVSWGRGAETINAIAADLPQDMQLEVIGPVDPGVTIAPAVGCRGFVPNSEALGYLPGATAGLSLLRDLPNYRHSMPTKILEYLAAGVPVIATPLPEAVEIVERFECGIIVPFDDPSAAVEALAFLKREESTRVRYGANGRRAVERYYNWHVDERRFTNALRRSAGLNR